MNSITYNLINILRGIRNDTYNTNFYTIVNAILLDITKYFKSDNRHTMKPIIFFILIALPCTTSAAELPLWQTARHTILECYGGWDVEFSVSGGYEHRVYDSGPLDGEFANAIISVPIYSRKHRLERQEHTNGRVEHLAELYAEHQSQTAIMDALDKEKQVLKRTMLDDGASGISAYYGLIKEVELAKSKRDGAGRKILNWLELCGYKQPKGQKNHVAEN